MRIDPRQWTAQQLADYRRRFARGENVQEIAQGDGVVFTYEAAGKLYAVAFHGKAAKPDWHYQFPRAERRQERIREFFEALVASAASKAEWQAQKRAGRCSTPAEVWEKARKGEGITAPDAAVCLRAALARRFPGTKFSVRADGSLSVNWTDGPSIQEVDQVAQNYSFQGFDGMIDMRYSVHRWLSRDGTMSLAHSTGTEGSRGSESEEIGDPHAPDAVEVRYGPDFVFTHREISPGVKRDLAFKVCSKYGISMPERFDDENSLERFLNTTLTAHGEYLCALVHRASCGEEL